MTYAPTTDKVRTAYVLARVEGGGLSWPDAEAEFAAWLETVQAEERKDSFDEGMWALGDMIGVDPEWYDRILRPSQKDL